MIKHIKILALSGLLMLTSVACFRDLPIDKLAEPSIWGSPILLDGYVTPWYRQMSHGFSFYMPSLSFAKSETRDYLPWYGDQVVISKNDWYLSAYGDLMKGDPLQLQLYSNTLWTRYYTQLRSINLFFENVSKIDDGDQKTRLLGEAHFFRAYYYYLLLRRYGGVFLIDKPYNPLESPVKFPRASFEQMVDYIASEASLAATFLRPEYDKNDRGRIRSGAALMLKGKTYFWASGVRFQSQNKSYMGFPDDRTRGMLEKAIAAYDEVIALKQYGLIIIDGNLKSEIVDKYRAIFTTKFSNESILEVNHSDNGDFSDGFGHKLDREAASPYFTGTTAANVPTENHFEEYRTVNGKKQSDPGSGYVKANKYMGLDYRFYANVLYDGAIYNGHVMDIHTRYEGDTQVKGVDLLPFGTSTSAAVTATGYYLAKFRKESMTVDNNATYGSSQNYIIWRYAELLLDYAEAKYLLGETDDALVLVNRVRSRAKVDTWTTITYEDLENERRIELAFEETTYWDVIRRGEAEQKFSHLNPIRGVNVVLQKNGTYTYEPFKVHSKESLVRNFSVRQYLLPIPWSDIRYHGIDQNPGHNEY